MTDKELLELAAKAAGRVFGDSVGEYVMRNICGHVMPVRRNANGTDTAWNPLTDDGDALRLAVKLEIVLDGFMHRVTQEEFTIDPYAATRRAIVRAAAEIGKEM